MQLGIMISGSSIGEHGTSPLSSAISSRGVISSADKGASATVFIMLKFERPPLLLGAVNTDLTGSVIDSFYSYGFCTLYPPPKAEAFGAVGAAFSSFGLIRDIYSGGTETFFLSSSASPVDADMLKQEGILGLLSVF